jgi:transposase InsO family protein
MHTNERKDSALDFLKAAVAHYGALGVTVKRLLTDNGSAYRSKLFAKTCQALGIKHTRDFCNSTSRKNIPCPLNSGSPLSPPRRFF